jgi:transcriptional regulator with XRE-family HTH domain
MNKTINNQRYVSLIKWLVAARKEKGLTVRQLAEIINETHQFVSKVERCQRRLNVYEFVQYCEGLGLEPTEGLSFLRSSSDS